MTKDHEENADVGIIRPRDVVLFGFQVLEVSDDKDLLYLKDDANHLGRWVHRRRVHSVIRYAVQANDSVTVAGETDVWSVIAVVDERAWLKMEQAGTRLCTDRIVYVSQLTIAPSAPSPDTAVTSPVMQSGDDALRIEDLRKTTSSAPDGLRVLVEHDKYNSFGLPTYTFVKEVVVRKVSDKWFVVLKI